MAMLKEFKVDRLEVKILSDRKTMGQYAAEQIAAQMRKLLAEKDEINMSFIMGGVRSVSGQIKTLAKKIEVEDTAVAALEFTNGALGTITASVATAPGYPRMLTISSTKGTIVLEEQHIRSCDIEGISLPQQRAEVHNYGTSNPTDIPVEGHAH